MKIEKNTTNDKKAEVSDIYNIKDTIPISTKISDRSTNKGKSAPLVNCVISVIIFLINSAEFLFKKKLYSLRR